jgi:hypothetical protein
LRFCDRDEVVRFVILDDRIGFALDGGVVRGVGLAVFLNGLPVSMFACLYVTDSRESVCLVIEEK